ncbi:MAG: 7TM diverse intracellular signaling domain-containing protein [Bacteroidota bacterium]
MQRGFVFALFLCLLAAPVFSQKPVALDNTHKQYIFSGNEFQLLEDKSNKLTINDIMADSLYHRFKINSDFYPKNYDLNATYWYKIKIKFTQPLDLNSSVFEFYDQTTDHITVYQPDTNGRYVQTTEGAAMAFGNRLFKHKNFEFPIYNRSKGERIYYIKIQSQNQVNVIIVYRKISHFIYYALTEYLTYGIFYGMILIFCFHNLLMFIAVKKRSYLFYVLYILSVGLYEMCTDGIAFQYIWPNAPNWNEYAYGTALYLVSLFALLFTRDLLHVRSINHKLYRLINYTILLRTLYFIFCLFEHKYFIYKFIEFIPLSLAFISGIVIRNSGFKPARFFVLGYAFLFFGFICKALSVLGFFQGLSGVIGFYSLGFSFILEMTFLSFAIGDQVRLFRREKEAAMDATIKQMAINSTLKDTLNQELEIKVEERTQEAINKSKQIFEQAQFIEQQNKELLYINEQLEKQAAEISMMNVLLEQDNTELKHNIEKVNDARALSTELSFEEFSAKYPDQESCNKFLAHLKWNNGFSCIKCANVSFHAGRAPYSRRCTKCNYEESVLFNTIFQNNRIPINKAFYIVYLMYTTKGAISSYQLSEKIGIRQSTCWQYAIRIKKVMDDHKREVRKSDNKGWSKLVMDNHPTHKEVHKLQAPHHN